MLTESTGRSSAQNPAFSSATPPHLFRGSATNPPGGAHGVLEPEHETLTELPPRTSSRHFSQQAISETPYDYDDNDDDSLYDSIYNNLNTTNTPDTAVAEPQSSSPDQQEDQDTQTNATPKAITVTHAAEEANNPLAVDAAQATSPKSSTFSRLGGFVFGTTSPSNSEFSSVATPASPLTTVATDDTSLASSQTLTTTSAKPGPNDTQATGSISTHSEPTLPKPPSDPTSTSETEIGDMEDELKAISAELASSIRREMDLEDLVERLQAEVNNPQAPGKRTSDYYSDSGISSAKFSEYDQTREEIEKVQRKAEQDKAQVRLDLTTKLQDEREKRRELDVQIKQLSDKAAQVDAGRSTVQDASGRLKTLEETCGDLRRKLAEERDAKSNIEDLLSVLKTDLETATNERDNLRDEVVPQLKARVDGLESQAADDTNLAYETTKMQQDLETLRQENESLRRIKEEAESRAIRASMTMSRSNSVASKPFKLQQPPATLARSNTTKKLESKEALAERLKDVEAQRDALHSALKNLLDRQEYQNRENTKRIRFLEVERERLLQDSPQKAGYEKDITNLRSEVSVLRRRAEDAMEQKWRVEKGLIGLKMDLDRAEEEMAMLRSLLLEKDILIPPMDFDRSDDARAQDARSLVTSESVEKAYRELETIYKEALGRVRQLESNGTSDEKTQLAMKRLELTLSSALSDRPTVHEEALACKTQLESVLAGETPAALVGQLSEASERVEELAGQVKSQLDANSKLRQRLADAVTRGESDRKSNVEQVTRLQNRLKSLEDQLVAAQNASEERVARHEAEITALREANNGRLGRRNERGDSPLRSPASKSPLPSPMFPRSPRAVPQKSIGDEAEMGRLRDRVAELERAVAESDKEMQEVVSRMSEAQIEVMRLQEDRDGAVRATKKVQAELEAEKMKGFAERFMGLGAEAK